MRIEAVAFGRFAGVVAHGGLRGLTLQAAQAYARHVLGAGPGPEGAFGDAQDEARQREHWQRHRLTPSILR